MVCFGLFGATMMNALLLERGPNAETNIEPNRESMPGRFRARMRFLIGFNAFSLLEDARFMILRMREAWAQKIQVSWFRVQGICDSMHAVYTAMMLGVPKPFPSSNPSAAHTPCPSAAPGDAISGTHST